MHSNNVVYKGYRLSAKLARPHASASGRTFSATIVVGLASTAPQTGSLYEVPQFRRGDFAATPGEAVHTAILFGREVVDGFHGEGPRVGSGHAYVQGR
ncbi:hypothetical protein [Bordetella genomosp. 9]|uniref:Uncharacterized protein n=1 Tax=Bordetella genomosp. 9 TaxID=1416803 RepID=A0A1W6Z1Q7_9BORD|nr:hypothetical protein [Bordetella genomosp. 9]ARP87181.1 hypothetical protein CAL13_13900 [Bordetella genomosp. 9]